MDKEESRVTDEERGAKTICIFGISSFVGSNLAEFFKRDFKVVGTFYRNRVKIPGVLTLPCDILAKGEVQMILHTFKPDYTIYCVGVSSLMKCHQNEEVADALNTTGIFHITEYCQRYKSKLCYISSSYVFEGGEKRYLEIDMPDATTVLGKTQATAEFYIQKTSLNYIVFRCCNFYGRTINPLMPSNFFEFMQEKVDLGDSVYCDDTLRVGFLDVYYLGMIMKICFKKEVINRLFHISSKDITTYYGFSMEYCNTFNHSSRSIAKKQWTFPVEKGKAMAEKLSFGLDTTNVESFCNVQFPTIRESLEFTYKKFNGSKVLRKVSGVGKGETVTYI